MKDIQDNLHSLEFESYYEYFLINTFQKGFSKSGCVDAEELKRRDHGIYYQKIQMNNIEDENDTSENTRNFGGSYQGSSSNKNNSKSLSKPVTIRRSSRLSKKEKEKEILKRTSDNKNLNNKKFKSAKVGKPIPQSSTNKKTDDIDNKIVICDLLEALVEKIPTPSRRSDWVLSPKNKYVPEKNTPIKPKNDNLVKIYQLTSNPKIQNILKKYKKN
ncbi:uncharacterized protein SCODWIG_03793 [Saccharomycodes ludwigii]|uniref:Uncharacterized protein n=1 Tax=Saccharomycodes ludwigii TaxID=36035 RepID=A0A376BBR2_9ASCO|nr:hypothetical protein SCDLUD_002226 [Saccharomycodes ludwigii]KAH3902404.1 hypothetical protein SCDLUD_002226 [Saccharomycodes ludwigii]SSD62031.1 uncharacterized protein SCODWIG_03793 [Saccharomycodes ludwigii]